jgi:hypothetical protein
MENEVVKELVETYFKDDYGQPMVLSAGQIEIFKTIFLRKHSRVNINASTQYGKSTSIALALILRSISKKESWAVIAGKTDKARIIMEKVIQHIFDNEFFVKQLEIDKNEPLERIKRERSKDKITWKGGGEIRIYSAQTKSQKNVNDALTGFGSPNIVEDESALIPDPFQTMILRMLGGHKDTCLVKIGNPFYRNHFYKTSISTKYYQIKIDYRQAMAEGRYTQEFIDEARENMTSQEFRVLYESEFPDEEEIDQQGYYRLVSDHQIDNAKKVVPHEGEYRLGFDVGEGGDENVGVLRSSKYAQIVHFSKISDLMATTRVINDLIDKYKIAPHNVFIDATGIGAGVVSRLKEIGLGVTGIKWASKPKKDVYTNLKAENFMSVGEAISAGFSLEPSDKWSELSIIKWKKDTQDKIKIKTKEEMRKEAIKSPNVADALALSFNRSLDEEAPNVWQL